MYTFNSRTQTLTVVLKPSIRQIVGAEVVKTNSLVARFERGIFQTEDDEVAKLLRDIVKRTNDHTIVEIDSEAKRAFEIAKNKLNTRDPLTAADTSEKGVSLKEDTSELTCPICEKKFRGIKNYQLHLINHRPGMAPKAEEKPAVSIAEKPAEGQNDTPNSVPSPEAPSKA